MPHLKQTQSADSKTHESKNKKEARKEQRRGKTGKRRSGCWCKEENEETQEGGKGEIAAPEGGTGLGFGNRRRREGFEKGLKGGKGKVFGG